jgi:hypothetical protein
MVSADGSIEKERCWGVTNNVCVYKTGASYLRKPALKRIVSRDEYLLKTYKNKQVLYVHALLVLTVSFSYLVIQKSKRKS